MEHDTRVSRVCDCKTSSTTHKWRQSLDEQALAFVVIDPDRLLTDYHIGVSGDEFLTRHPLFPVSASDSTQCLAQAQT
jgi:hypothetical protein